MPYCRECGTSIDDGVKFCPECGTPSSDEPLAPAIEASPPARVSPTAVAVLVASLVVAMAAFLPWESLFVFSVAGTKGDGVITLVVGAIGAGLAGIFVKRGSRVLFVGELVLAVLALVVAAVHLNDKTAAEGIFVTFVASLVWLVAAIVGLARPHGKPRQGT
jgi:hypothetical protein